MRRVGLFLFLWAFPCGANAQKAYVVLVSYDGFRHDYVDRFDLPNFKKFIRSGASAAALVPSFPSLTFPNHYTLITGLYPGHHGIISNRFVDRPSGREYTMDDADAVTDAYFYRGLPLWQLAQKHGMITASYFWVGSEARIHGQLPTYSVPYDYRIPNAARVQKVLEWFSYPEERRPRFVSLYFSMTDHAGHLSGPNGQEVREAALEADSMLGLLMEGVVRTGLAINVIVVSDHGMHDMRTEDRTFIDLERMIPKGLDGVNVITSSTLSNLYISDSTRKEEIYRALSGKDGRFRIFYREQLPAKWNYLDSDRTGDLVVVAEPGYYVVSAHRGKKESDTWGAHGFDPDVDEQMHGIFYASGPNIRGGARVSKFRNVHVYPFIARILGLPLPVIDGDPAVLEPLYVP